MKYLTQTKEVYRVDTELEAQNLINEAKKESSSNLKTYTSDYKCKKTKSGDIEDEYYKVTLIKEFNEEKNPECVVEITYDVNHFPTAVGGEKTYEVEL